MHKKKKHWLLLVRVVIFSFIAPASLCLAESGAVPHSDANAVNADVTPANPIVDNSVPISDEGTSGAQDKQPKEKMLRIMMSKDDLTIGIKEMLRIATERSVARLGKDQGYGNNTNVRIKLPEQMERVDYIMRKYDNSHMVDKLIYRMNRAAEKATPHVGGYFLLAIKQIDIENPQDLLNSNDALATDYLRSKMLHGLRKAVDPIVMTQMKKAGANTAYKQLMNEYRKVPYEPNVRGDINQYVLQKTLDAMFRQLGVEETSIKTNPEKRSTEILKKLYGGS